MTTVTLAERLDLPQAAPLADALRAAPGDLTIDAGAVTHLGGLCLQVLLAARQACDDRGTAFALASPSAAFLRALADFGLADFGLADLGPPPTTFSQPEVTP